MNPIDSPHQVALLAQRRSLAASASHAAKRLRRWRPRVYLGAAAIMASLFLYGLVSAIPNRTAVSLENQGKNALLSGRYAAAERAFNGVLEYEPRSTHARFGLACAYFLTGSDGLAVLELDLAFKQGLVLRRAGGCSHELVFNDRLFTAKFGLTDSFAAPRGAPLYQAALEAVPTDTPEDTAERLLIGSCLAFRAHLDDVGWYYAANAHDLGRITPTATRNFFQCLQPATRARLGCGNSLSECIFTDHVRAAYLRDRPYLYPSHLTGISRV